MKMYVFYEHLRDVDGKVLATDAVASSHGSGKGLDWKSEGAEFAIILALFKTPPLNKRKFDEPTKVWTFFDDYGQMLLDKIEEAFKAAGFKKIIFEEIEDLAGQLKADGGIDRTKKKVDPSKFYYNQQPVAKGKLSKAQAAVKLAILLGTDIEAFKALEKVAPDAPKRLYRQAALRYHPDRNGGDSSKMSELNMLWGIYNG